MSRRKPPEERQRRNTADAGPLELVSPADRPVPPVPSLPGGGKIRAAVRDWWVDYWRDGISSLADRRADVAGLTRLALLYDQRLRAEAAYRKAPTSTGSTGQLTLSPFAREIASLDGRILALEDRFGLNPKSRLELGAQLGAAADGLEKMNAAITRAFADEPDEDDELDPRRRAIEAEAKEAG